MKFPALLLIALFLGSALSSFPQTTAQSRPDATSSQSFNSEVEYPMDDGGVLIDSSGWKEILPTPPAERRVKRAIAASLTYGAIPARLVAEYDGLHADVQLLALQAGEHALMLGTWNMNIFPFTVFESQQHQVRSRKRR